MEQWFSKFRYFTKILNVSSNQMKALIIFISTNLILAPSCGDLGQSAHSNSKQDSIASDMTKAKNSGEKVEGKFLDIQKLTDKIYSLSILLNQDSVAIFETYMPIDQNEISLLKKEGNNIILTYKLYQNPVTKKPIRMVQYMQPVYELQNK